MEVGVPSFENLVVIQLASRLIKIPVINKEIFCLPGSEYFERKDAEFLHLRESLHELLIIHTYYKKLWYEVVERKTKILTEKLCLTKQLQVKVIGTVLLLGLKILNWAAYHMRILNLPHTYINMNFLSSCFNDQGIIDNKLAANYLMRDEHLNNQQKYKLACIYCSAELPTLYKLMTEEDREVCHNPSALEKIKCPPIIKFWTDYCSGEIGRLINSKNIYKYMLDKAIESGSLAAVDYALKRINFSKNSKILVKAALKATRIRSSFKCRDDTFIFEHGEFKCVQMQWVPSDYYVEIVSLLLLKMTKCEQIQFIHKDIECNSNFKLTSRVLEPFLDWPYQNYFLKVVETIWEYFPECAFARLLLKICKKVKHGSHEYERYGEEMCYNYKKLLGEFWCQSPESLKKSIFCDIFEEDGQRTNFGEFILCELLSQKTLNKEDIENIHLILSAVTNEVRESLCLYLMKHTKWITLNEFMHSIFQSEDRVISFKKSTCVSSDGVLWCVQYITDDNWDGLESYIRWSCLSEEEISILKKKISPIVFEKLNEISHAKIVQVFNRFCTWCFTSNEETKEYKRLFAYTCKFIDFLEASEFDLADELISFCMSTEKEVTELKRYIADKWGSYYCERILTEYNTLFTLKSQKCAVIPTSELKRNKWEEIMLFLTWCFSSEEEINIFKKKYLFETRGKDIHAALVIHSQYNEAEIFFTWLELSSDEIKHLKQTIFFVKEIVQILLGVLTYSKMYVDYENKQEAFELLLRWCFTDREAILEFQNIFEGYNNTYSIVIPRWVLIDSSWNTEIFKEISRTSTLFKLGIQQRLEDMEDEQREVKLNKANIKDANNSSVEFYV